MSAASDKASIAADAIAWALMSAPSERLSLTLSQKRELSMRAHHLLEQYRDDAECDPNTFTQDFFQSLKEAMADYSYDIANEGER